MKQSRSTLKVLPDTTLRRLRNTPSYFFLVWRWSMWIYAAVTILGSGPSYQAQPVFRTCLVLLGITLIQTLVITLYAPVIQILLPNIPRINTLRTLNRRSPAVEEEPDLLTPLARTRNPYWDLTIYGLDVVICGLVMYYSGPFGINPNFGVSSPFYRYGMSTAFASALAYRYKGGLAAALGYDLFALLGALLPAPGGIHSYQPNIIDITGCLVDTPVAAILVAYVATLLENYTRSRKREQDNARRQSALVRVGEALVKSASNPQGLIQQGAPWIRRGGHFDYLVIALVETSHEQEENIQPHLEVSTYVDTNMPLKVLLPESSSCIQRVIQTGEPIITFERLQDSNEPNKGIARLYLPLFKDSQVQLVLGAEGKRGLPFSEAQEEFLTIAGRQLLVAIENIHLTEQTIQLAANAERGRIAREIHDGIAQLVYMLSLNAETCSTQARRIAEASEEDAELVTPLADRLDKLVTVSKQALWETRNYMFSLKPLMIGSTTLTEMLTNQLHEFETISDLLVLLDIQGKEDSIEEERRRSRTYAQAGTAIFRIVQEALTNAYKHAHATQIHVILHYHPDIIEVEICDNGKGLQVPVHSHGPSKNGEQRRIYSGHGLRGMRERATELGGTLEITQQQSSGVKILVRIPI